jgi:hypothetical protein
MIASYRESGQAISVTTNFGAGEWVGVILMPLAVACFLLWYSKYAANKSWLNK